MQEKNVNMAINKEIITNDIFTKAIKSVISVIYINFSKSIFIFRYLNYYTQERSIIWL